MTHHPKKRYSIFSELLGLVISLVVVIYILPKLPFVTANYSLWLPVAISTSIISSVFDMAKYCFNNRFYYGLKTLAIVPDIFSTWILATIYPLDFSLIGYGMFTSLVQFTLYVSVLGMMIAVIVNFVKFLTFSDLTS